MLLDGAQSSLAGVSSGVPQETVLGPILFLIYINDLPDCVSHSNIRLFADDCIIRDVLKLLRTLNFFKRILMLLSNGLYNG